MIGTLLLNRYKILEKIAEGGMGIVYKAKCTLLNRFVAVKILKPEFNNNADFVTRFKREANSIASLSYPTIVSIYDVGSENNINFIVMEYINGKTLKQVIKENVKLDPLTALNITLKIADALEYAHKNNIIHRDVKPDNILITTDNIIKLTDFGIAKISDSVTITNSNKTMGSVHYFSPEQAKGKLVDCRTDLYALGIVMYEMITGKVPYDGDSSIAIAMAHIQEAIVPPKEIITNIPENINKIILKALEKDPINRFQTAKELIEILKEIRINPNLEIDFENKSTDATKVMMTDETVLLDDEIDDSTISINEPILSETLVLKDHKAKLSKHNFLNKNKKTILIIGSFILIIIISILVKYTYDYTPDSSKNSKDSSSEDITKQKESVKPTTDEKKIVPLLIGKNQDTAEDTIANSGFLLGNITSEYNDTIPSGQVISQSPSADKSCDKDTKIDLVISLGQKTTQIEPQTKSNENVTENSYATPSNNNSNNNNNNSNNNGKGNGKDKQQKDKKLKK